MNENNKLSEFLDKFLSTPEPDIDMEYFEITKAYEKMFGHGIPREMISNGITDEQIKQAVKTCLEDKEDKLFDLLGIEIYEGLIY